jgi:hypothetical protein
VSERPYYVDHYHQHRSEYYAWYSHQGDSYRDKHYSDRSRDRRQVIRPDNRPHATQPVVHPADNREHVSQPVMRPAENRERKPDARPEIRPQPQPQQNANHQPKDEPKPKPHKKGDD